MHRLAALVLATLLGAVLGARAALHATCPSGSWRDGARAARVLGALEATREGAALLDRARPLGAVCFGATRGITPDGMILVDARTRDPEAAAYLGHLLAHRAERTPGPPPSDRAACDAWVARARAAEERASALEAHLARALGTEYRGAEVDLRVAEYAARCEREAR